MAIRPVTFDSPTAVRDAAYVLWERDNCTWKDPEADGAAEAAWEAAWSAAMEHALERIQVVQDSLEECDGPGDVDELLKALQDRLRHTMGGA